MLLFFTLDLSGIVWGALNFFLLISAGGVMLISLIVAYARAGSSGIKLKDQPAIALVIGAIPSVAASGLGLLLLAGDAFDKATRKDLDAIAQFFVFALVVIQVILSVRIWRNKRRALDAQHSSSNQV